MDTAATAGPSRSSNSSGPSSRSSSPSLKGKERAIEPETGDSHGSEASIVDSESEVDRDPSEYGNGQRIDGEDSEEDEEGYEEEEPYAYLAINTDSRILKYSKLKGHLPEVLAKDQVSAIAVGTRIIALGTQHGMVHVLSYEGNKISSYRPHSANITSIRIDEENEIIATASFEGRVMIRSLTTPETHAFDYHRPIHALALEPDFNKKANKAFVCGGMAGKLVMQEKGWLGYKEQVIHSGEGPIWAIEWRGNLIAWANDLGVKVYDTSSGQRIGYIAREDNAPRAELFKCSLLWKDDSTLIIAWADHIKVIRIRTRPKAQSDTGLPTLYLHNTGLFQLDCMISGIAFLESRYVILAYIPPDDFDESVIDRDAQRRKAANRPEIRLIENGEEAMADELNLSNFHSNGCNNYSLIKSGRPDEDLYLVVSPTEVVEVRPRDEVDHINWLVDHERFEEALAAAEKLREKGKTNLDIKAIGARYMHHLVDKGEHHRAASLAKKVFGQDVQAWTSSITLFIDHGKLEAILPEIPTSSPKLESSTYDKVLLHLVEHDKEALVRTTRTWPAAVYNVDVVMGTVQGELSASRNDKLLLEAMGEILLANEQPDKALPYFLQLKQPRVFDLIRKHNLFISVQDQVVLLVDQGPDSGAIPLLVDHIHSIPIERAVRQLEERPEYLFKYLQAIFQKDQALAFPYSDRMISLGATYDPSQLLPLLRASNAYDLEKAYNVCKEHDLVPEMVFLLGRMGNNRQALMLIIERLGDVQAAIAFARDQADDDLWEDLLQYSESRPNFIRALLEHVGAEINPIRLIKRIKDGMEIPGLKAALIKIVQASNLQVSLSEDCYRILNGDCSSLASELQIAQTHGVQASRDSSCIVCGLAAFKDLALVYFCQHLVHATCALISEDAELPDRTESTSISYLLSGDRVRTKRRELGNKLSHAAAVRTRVKKCPVCTVSRGNLAY